MRKEKKNRKNEFFFSNIRRRSQIEKKTLSIRNYSISRSFISVTSFIFTIPSLFTHHFSYKCVLKFISDIFFVNFVLFIFWTLWTVTSEVDLIYPFANRLSIWDYILIVSVYRYTADRSRAHKRPHLDKKRKQISNHFQPKCWPMNALNWIPKSIWNSKELRKTLISNNLGIILPGMLFLCTKYKARVNQTFPHFMLT